MLGDGYGKIFKQIFAGTLRANWKALITFEQMLVLCDPNGILDWPPEVIHNVTGIPLDIITDGIAVLERPDPKSRSPKCEGRRIVRLEAHRDWGWQIVNHEEYKLLITREEKRAADRERIAAKREATKNPNENNDVAGCRKVSHADATDSDERDMSQKSQESRMSHTHTHTQTQLSTPNGVEVGSAAAAPCPHQEIVKLYHELLPMCPPVRSWHKTRQSYLQARWREDKKRQSLDWWRKFFTHVAKSKFLTGGATATRDRPTFFASLEWLLRPNNFARVIEGQYHRGR